jgi:hypothetical protein
VSPAPPTLGRDPSLGRDLFVVHSPWQLLNAEEAREVYGSTGGDLLVQIDEQLRPDQIEVVLAQSSFDRVRMVDPGHLDQLDLEGPRRAFLGDYRNPFQRRIARAVGAVRPVALDDGNATLMLADQRARRLWRLRDRKRQSASSARYERVIPVPGLISDLRHPGAANFSSIELFSIYQVRGARRDCYVPNTLSRLKRQVPPETAPRHPIFIGSHIAEVGTMHPEAYAAKLERAIEETDGTLLYFAHRKESDEMVARYRTRFGLEVVRPRVPIELALIEMAVRPSEIWSVLSSAFDTLRVLFPEAVPRWQPPAPEDLAEPYRRPVARLIELTARARLAT